MDNRTLLITSIVVQFFMMLGLFIWMAEARSELDRKLRAVFFRQGQGHQPTQHTRREPGQDGFDPTTASEE